MIGVSSYLISKMERGLLPIEKSIAKKLAKLFKIDHKIFSYNKSKPNSNTLGA